jgi:Fe-S-cluster-containing dehydrogenase component
MDRRDFLKTVGVASTTLLTKNTPLQAKESKKDPKEFMGILVDTTRCIGCQTCEEVCAEVNGLPEPDFERDLFKDHIRTSETQFTVVNGFETEKGDITVKRQCMHCNQPACVSACPTNAMEKTPEGPVIWHEDRCMGCRACMVSCPFGIPQFEDNKANPNIMKCFMCWDRLQEGEQPACVENCPAEALTYGKRRDLLEIARQRTYENPDDYYHHIYGEHEVGGTGYLYLSAVPFEEIGFRTDLGNEALPKKTTGFLYSVPFVLTMWPALLLGISKATEGNEETTKSEE